MIVAEITLLVAFFLDDVTIPFVMILGLYQLCEAFSWGMTYYGFHCLFTLPQLAVLFYYAKKSAETPEYFRLACKWMAVLCVVATAYSTPWDNYLVASGVWGYGGAGKTLGVIGYVPIEEYAFFSIQTLIVGLIWTAHARCAIIPHFRAHKSKRTQGIVAFALLTIIGVLLLQVQRARYLGLITVWAMPILAVQWAFGADALMAQRFIWLKPLLYSWFYLCIIDRWAIRNGCWSINPKQTLPVIDWLPLEEAYFFLVTTTMCTWGLQLAMNVTSLDCPQSVPFRRVFYWCRKGNDEATVNEGMDLELPKLSKSFGIKKAYGSKVQ